MGHLRMWIAYLGVSGGWSQWWCPLTRRYKGGLGGRRGGGYRHIIHLQYMIQ
jgi:hypothetical protein